MTSEHGKRRRRQVLNLLGAEFERKATNEFCAAFTRPSPATATADDESARHVLMVVELVPLDPRIGWLDDALTRVRAHPGWDDAVKGARSSLADGGRAGAERLVNASSLLRQAGIAESRERSYLMAGSIRAELDKVGASLADAASASASGSSSPVQYCWTNQSFLAWVDPRDLAELAGESLIYRLDVPRPLELQIDRTGKTLRAVQHRTATGNGGRGVKVAVIDTEVAPLASVFQNRVIHRKNFTSEKWGNPHEHGTTVAGIIAARGATVSGMAPEAVIYNYKVVAATSGAAGIDLHGAQALTQALEDGADIANCSWTTNFPTNGQSRAARTCDTVWAHGMTVVAAVGNKGSNAGSVEAPADAKGVIAVGATDVDGTAVEPYSASGPTLNGKPGPDMVAPGGNNVVQVRCFGTSGSFVDCGRGTSFAAPHVSGLLALLLADKPDLTPDEHAQLLKSLCRKLPGNLNRQGAGCPVLP